MKLVSQRAAEQAEVQGDTPALRLVSLLEHVASRDHLHTLQGLAEATGLPKPTLHRMLQQLEAAGLLQREGDGRHWGTGSRLRRLAQNLLLNSSLHAARRQVLRRLVDEVGESCNITALSGGEVLYLDRVETAAPLRFYLQPGSRVPMHCSASGKVFLSQMTPAQRQRLLGAAPLEACTPRTVTDLHGLEQELRRVKVEGCGFDDEEFLPGLTCAAVPVTPADPKARASLCVALQGPTVRLNRDKLQTLLPALHTAAQALSRLEEGAPSSERTERTKTS
ncbi:MAG: IclR family transcriptional regulator [Rubrivivax sp.]